MEDDLDIFLSTTKLDLSELPPDLKSLIRFKKVREHSRILIRDICNYFQMPKIEPDPNEDLDLYLAEAGDDLKLLPPHLLAAINTKPKRHKSKQLIMLCRNSIRTAKYKIRSKTHESKTCIYCQKELPIQQFGLKTCRLDGRSSICKICRRDYTRGIRAAKLKN